MAILLFQVEWVHLHRVRQQNFVHPLLSMLRRGLADSHRARVQRGESATARCASIGNRLASAILNWKLLSQCGYSNWCLAGDCPPIDCMSGYPTCRCVRPLRSGSNDEAVLSEPVAVELTGFERARLSQVLMQASAGD
jgi:hypothetical protein